MLLRRLNELSRKAGLAEDDPYGCHRRRARAEVEGQGSLPLAVQGSLARAHGGLVNFAELRRAREFLVRDLDASAGAGSQPAQEGPDIYLGVVRHEEYLV